jgi:hypothetical protein
MEIEKNGLIYLICPVRNATAKEKEFLENYVDEQEEEGYRVHYPLRDVNQEDPIGLKILSEHKLAMDECNEVHAYWNPKSSGSFFDFGMAFMDEKLPWEIINYDMIQEKELGNFERFIAMNSLVGRLAATDGSEILNDQLRDYRGWLNNTERVEYEVKDLTKRFLFEFGMAFFAEKPIILKNRDYVETLRTPSKSFYNVLLSLDKASRAEYE